MDIDRNARPSTKAPPLAASPLEKAARKAATRRYYTEERLAMQSSLANAYVRS